MKVADAIKQMSKLPLQRIVDSFTKDFPKPDEDQARDIILRNVEELTDGKRITTVLQSPTGNESRPFYSSTVPSRTRSGRY